MAVDYAQCSSGAMEAQSFPPPWAQDLWSALEAGGAIEIDILSVESGMDRSTGAHPDWGVARCVGVDWAAPKGIRGFRRPGRHVAWIDRLGGIVRVTSVADINGSAFFLDGAAMKPRARRSLEAMGLIEPLAATAWERFEQRKACLPPNLGWLMGSEPGSRTSKALFDACMEQARERDDIERSCADGCSPSPRRCRSI